jgi:NAD(P)-dependent dehydrogenase (short-subunit alcohol dehydrogenase family)
VIVAARNERALDELAADLIARGGAAIVVPCDVRDERSVERMATAAWSWQGRLDGAFNNAGASAPRRALHQSTTAEFDEAIAVNLRGTYLCLRYELECMLASGGGAIVNTSSVGGLVGVAHQADYVASKWGVCGLTKAVALDYAESGVRVNAIAPGPVDTAMLRTWAGGVEKMQAFAGRFPMGRISDPTEVALAALFLLSDESRFVTGTVLPCDGGYTAR